MSGRSAGLFALLVAGLALRLPGVLGRPLWLDEAIGIGVATSAAPLHALATTDLHPPLLALLTWGIAHLGTGDAWVRLPSLLASLATIPLAASAGRAWGSTRAGRLAAAAAAVLPPLVLYGAEARPYALGVALLTAFVGAIGARRDRLAAIVGALAAATLYGAWPVLVVGGLLRARERRWAPLLVPSAVIVALAATLLPAQLAHQGAHLRDGFLADAFWTPATLPSWLARTPAATAGWLLTATGGRVARGLGAIGLLAIVATARGRRPDALTTLAWGPVAVLFVLAGAGLHPLGPTRHALVLLPGLLLWACRRAQAAPTYAAIVVGVVGGAGLVTVRTAPREDVPKLVAALDRLDSAPLVADASAAPQLARYADRAVLPLPWVRGDRLDGALGGTAPDGAFWFVVGSTGTVALDDAERWAGDEDRALGPLVVRKGTSARRIGPVRHSGQENASSSD